MCECSNAEIERECSRNAGGMKPTVDVACVDEVASIGAATDHAVSTITMRAAASPIPAGKFHSWACKRKDSDFTSKQNPDTGMWETSFKYFIPKQTSAKAVILNDLGEENNILVVYDMNGAKRIIGAVDNPADIKVEEVTTPKNGYNVSGTWESSYSPYFYTGSAPTSL